MAKVLVTEDYLKNIGDAIRSKTETEETYTPSQMADAISNIESGEGVLWTTDGRLYNTILSIPEGTSKIGDYAFYSCTGIEELVLPDSVTSVGEQSFHYCEKLSKITFGSGLQSIGNQSFRLCRDALTEVDLSNTRVETIGTNAFRNCDCLTKLLLPNSLTSTATSTSGSFSSCANLTYVTLEDGFLCNLNLSASTQFSANAIIVMLNALGEVPKQETRTLTLGATNLAKLTDTQKQIATDKGWTLA